MRGFLIRSLISALGLWIAAKLVPSMHFDGAGTLLLAAVLLGVVNAVVRPLFLVLTLPITVLTLGAFLLVVNAAMLGLVAALLDGFWLGGFWARVLRRADREPDRRDRVLVDRPARAGRGDRDARRAGRVGRSHRCAGSDEELGTDGLLWGRPHFMARPRACAALRAKAERGLRSTSARATPHRRPSGRVLWGARGTSSREPAASAACLVVRGLADDRRRRDQLECVEDGLVPCMEHAVRLMKPDERN